MDYRKFTLEDIETLRAKTGVSYEEAVSLLEKYDGDIARALIELEKRGQLGGKNHFSGIKVDGNVAEFFNKWWKKGYTTRVIVERKGRTLADLSVLFMILALLVGARLLLVSIILALVLGCHVRIHVEEEAEQTVPADEADGSEPANESQEEAPKEEEDGFHTITIE